MKNLILIFFIYLLVFSCALFNSYEKQINNFSYPNNLLPDKTIKMNDGYFEKEMIPGLVTKAQAAVVEFCEGELNDDDTPDAVSIIALSTTGNEVFYYLYVLIGKDGNLHYYSHILLGDRIKLKLLKIMNKKIYLAYLVAGPDDTPGNPSKLKKVILGLKNNKIVVLK